MSYAPSKDISIALQVGPVAVSMCAEDVSWNPDVANDMQNRLVAMMREALAEAAAWGMLKTDAEVMFDDGSHEMVDEDEDVDG